MFKILNIFQLFILIFCGDFVLSRRVASIENVRRKLPESIKPCDNFYRFVCFENTKPSIFEQMKISMFETGHKLIRTSKSVNSVKLRNFYKSCVNAKSIKRQSLRSYRKWVKDFLSSIKGFQNLEDRTQRFQKQLQFVKTIPPYHQLFTLEAAIDTFNTSKMILQISQPRLYLFNDLLKEQNKTIFQIKKVHQLRLMKSIAKHFGEKISIKDIHKMIRLEIELNKIWKDSPKIGLDHISKDNLTLVCQIIDGSMISRIYENVSEARIPNLQFIQMTSVKSFIQTCKLLNYLLRSKSRFRILENYLKWSTIYSASKLVFFRGLKDTMNTELEIFLTDTESLKKMNHDSYKQYLREDGKNECLNIINIIFPLALSSIYASTLENSEEIKADISNIFQNLADVLESKFLSSSWITEEDKESLIEKIHLMKPNILYPEIVEDENRVYEYYKNTKIYKNNFFQNMVNAAEFSYKNHLRSLVDMSIDRYFTAFEINAYYVYQRNEIHIPMGILQSQIFDTNMTTMEKYSKLGFIIGHEISHGFDTLGIHFDGFGNLNPLLDKESRKEYENRASCYIHQYNSYNLPGLFELKENMADNVALDLSYQLFKNINGKTTETDIQKFYYSFAQMFCYLSKNDGKTVIFTDPHSPNKYRINGPIRNSFDFSRGYNCSKASEVDSQQKCNMW